MSGTTREVTMSVYISSQAAHPLLLGLDVLKNDLGAVLDLDKDVCHLRKLGNIQVPMKPVEERCLIPGQQSSVATLRLPESLALPAWHEVIVPVQVIDGPLHLVNEEGVHTLGVVDSLDAAVAKYGSFCGQGVTEVGADGFCKVQLANMSDHDIQLSPGTNVAAIVPRSRQQVNAMCIRQDPLTKLGEVRSSKEFSRQDKTAATWLSAHVEELRIALSIGYEGRQSLTLEQQLKIDAWIWKHAEDFVGKGVPLGRTKTLKHRIDTGNAKPHNCPHGYLDLRRKRLSQESSRSFWNKM